MLWTGSATLTIKFAAYLLSSLQVRSLVPCVRDPFVQIPDISEPSAPKHVFEIDYLPVMVSTYKQASPVHFWVLVQVQGSVCMFIVGKVAVDVRVLTERYLLIDTPSGRHLKTSGYDHEYQQHPFIYIHSKCIASAT